MGRVRAESYSVTSDFITEEATKQGNGMWEEPSRVQLFATAQTVARQASLSMGFPQGRILEWVAIYPPGDDV